MIDAVAGAESDPLAVRRKSEGGDMVGWQCCITEETAGCDRPDGDFAVMADARQVFAVGRECVDRPEAPHFLARHEVPKGCPTCGFVSVAKGVVVIFIEPSCQQQTSAIG